MASTFLLPFSTTATPAAATHHHHRATAPRFSLTPSIGCCAPKYGTRRPCVASAAAAAPRDKAGGSDEGESQCGTASISLCRRQGLAAVCLAAMTPSLPAMAAILEADDDLELLERVKEDRKKRIERQGFINSSDKERGYLQELVYKLSKVGQAIENNDLSTASSVLGPNTDADWVQNINAAFTKLSSRHEEKTEVDAFNSSLVSLISSVGKNDVESSKLAFVSSASALEKWVALTGLVGQLKGL